MRIAVVGAGISGLLTLYTIQKKFIETGKFGDQLEVIAYERGEQIGGEWILADEPETCDSTDIPTTSSIYRGLRTNNPTPFSEIHPDFPWPQGTPTFPNHEEFLAYIQNFCKTFNLSRFIRFSTRITNVKRNGDNLNVTTKDLKTGCETCEHFNFVFLCVGQHRQPFIPDDADTGQFSGMKLHYHNLKDPERLRGKRVLVVGTGVGGMDMAAMLPGTAAEHVYFSWDKFKPTWFNDKLVSCTLKPKLVRAVGNTAVFVDGSSVEIDVILYATGFRQVHPLDDDLQLDFHAVPLLFPLYKHVVHPVCPNIFFIGKAAAFIVASMRFQCELGCAVIDGRAVLPSTQEMLADINRFQSKWLPQFATMFDGDITKYFPIHELEKEVANEMASMAGCPPFDEFLFNVGYALLEKMTNNVQTYRRYRLVDQKNDDISSRNHLFV